MLVWELGIHQEKQIKNSCLHATSILVERVWTLKTKRIKMHSLSNCDACYGENIIKQERRLKRGRKQVGHLNRVSRKTATKLRLFGEKSISMWEQPVLSETVLQEAISGKKMLIASSLVRTLKLTKKLLPG